MLRGTQSLRMCAGSTLIHRRTPSVAPRFSDISRGSCGGDKAHYTTSYLIRPNAILYSNLFLGLIDGMGPESISHPPIESDTQSINQSAIQSARQSTNLAADQSFIHPIAAVARKIPTPSSRYASLFGGGRRFSSRSDAPRRSPENRSRVFRFDWA